MIQWYTTSCCEKVQKTYDTRDRYALQFVFLAYFRAWGWLALTCLSQNGGFYGGNMLHVMDQVCMKTFIWKQNFIEANCSNRHKIVSYGYGRSTTRLKRKFHWSSRRQHVARNRLVSYHTIFLESLSCIKIAVGMKEQSVWSKKR